MKRVTQVHNLISGALQEVSTLKKQATQSLQIERALC